MRKEEVLNELISISIQISSQNSLDELLNTIVQKARGITASDAGSLYLKQGNELLFLITQNDTLNNPAGSFKSFAMPINRKSIAGYAADTGEILNIEDVYHIPSEFPFSYNRDFDEKNNYRCKSMLTVPMKDNESNVIGILQLINAKDEAGEIISFDRHIEPLVESFASMAAVSIKNVQLKDSIKQAYLETIYRLSVAAEYKDTDTGMHIKRMSRYSEIIAQAMGMNSDFCEKMLYASPLHDIGKIGIPDAVLLKPAKLNDEEWEIMRSHTTMGYEILKDADNELINFAGSIALYHHEKFDGTGYPGKIKGKDIPIEGRIVALADVFDALSSKRPYKEPWPLEKILDVIKKDSGTHFDPEVSEAFFSNIEKILAVRDSYDE